MIDEVADCWNEIVDALEGIKSADNESEILAAAKRLRAGNACYRYLLS